MIKALLAVITLAISPLLSSAANAAPCERVTSAGSVFDLCRFPNQGAKSLEIRTFWKAKDGTPYGTLSRLEKNFAGSKSKLAFACNGSASQSDLTPVGYYVEDSVEHVPIVKSSDEGLGNLYIRPNGVFFVVNGRAGVQSTDEFIASKVKPEYAIQSGPMLLMNGAISSRLDAKGTSLKTRNAVCVGDDLVFAISNEALNFYTFATFLKSVGCKNALNLDVSTSSFFAPSLQRSDLWTPMGAMIGVIEH